MKVRNWLFIIIIIASFLRLWKLSSVPVSMFGDELDVGYHAYSIVKTGRDYSGNLMPINFQSLAEWRTPLYLYASVPTVALWGITPLGVRLPAAIFGIISIWGMYAVTRELLFYSRLSTLRKDTIALISAFVLALSPWHIQYSRAGFEVTMLILFYLFGLYYFFKAVRQTSLSGETIVKSDSIESRNEKSFGGVYLSLAVIHLVLTPLIYNTAKFFTPLLLVMLALVWRREIFSLQKKYLLGAASSGLLLGLLVIYATLGVGGTERFGYLSVFSDPMRETEIGELREASVRARTGGITLEPNVIDTLVYNKFTFWAGKIIDNYGQSFSTDFLFLNGDPNLRHSIANMGQLYVIEFVSLIAGLALFFSKKINSKIKWLLGIWIVLGILPSAITRDGGMHATRLFLILPPFTILVAYGVSSIADLKGKLPLLFSTLYGFLLFVNIISYQYNYWTVNRFTSERWWHSGYREVFSYVKEHESEYDRVLISDKSEPPWIFFAGHMQYDPVAWQRVKPDTNWVETADYGRVTMIDKYIFGSLNGQMYDWDLGADTLFVASEKEVGINLYLEPERTPSGLTLLQSITYPSGQPAFYLFTGR